MVAHPDLEAAPPSAPRLARELARTVTAGTNINITNFDERNSESFVAVYYQSPNFLVAASNNISGSGRQKQFASSDFGATWSTSELPLADEAQFHSDPALAWSTDGTAWAATLGITASPSLIQVQMYKSTDRGSTWSFVAAVSTGNDNDKELMCIDAHPASPFKDNIYVAWDRPGSGMRFTRSTDQGTSWAPVLTLSSDAAIGTHLATGPGGELYVGWPDTDSRELRITKSTDGGATFGATRVIATTNDSFEIAIPAMCQRKALIYLSLAVDRSGGPHSGWAYAAWTDRNGSTADPGCGGTGSTSNSNVYFSRSQDGGNTWSAPVVVHSNPAKTDQFNQWMDVDPSDGAIHVIYYDTRDHAGRVRTHVYGVVSRDGGDTWVDETRITTDFTDETVAGADSGNQYGDYNGLAVYQGACHPVWTDRRTGVLGGNEQIFTISSAPAAAGISLDLCTSKPWACVDAGMSAGQLTLDCPVRGCLVLAAMPRLCQVVLDCPTAASGPPTYVFELEDLAPDWQVGIVDADGQPAPVQTADQGEKRLITFRPSEDRFVDTRIGDYYLVFSLHPEGTPAHPVAVSISVTTSPTPPR
ncbi:MAG TPA: sialidase family protein [Acidobacteriota bacterium]